MANTREFADAVVTALNAHTFSMPFTAVRAKFPVFGQQDLAQLCVTVVARSLTLVRQDRGVNWQSVAPIEIIVQKKIVLPGEAQRTNLDRMLAIVGETDPLEVFCEEVRDYLLENRVMNRPVVECEQLLYDEDALNEHEYYSQITLGYRI